MGLRKAAAFQRDSLLHAVVKDVIPSSVVLLRKSRRSIELIPDHCLDLICYVRTDLCLRIFRPWCA